MSSTGDFIIENGVLTRYLGPGGDVVIPDHVTAIGKNAFSNCTTMTSINVPDSVKSVNAVAFKGCTGLADQDGFIIIRGTLFDYVGPGGDVTIPDSVKGIGAAAFIRNEKLESLNIPESVTRIWPGAFKGCKGLADSEGFVIVRGILYDYTGPGGNVVIPEGVKVISMSVFAGCQRMTNVTIPGTVTSFERGAFISCNGMKDIVIPEGVTEIGDEVFKECRNLWSVTIPKSLEKVGNDAFYGCDNLRGVTLPVGLERIGEEAFRNCSSLTSITIPDSVISMGASAFYGCERLTEVKLPASLTSISDHMFYGCESLKYVTIPNTVISIGERAFSGCDSLEAVTIPEGVERIEQGTFWGCESLKSIIISEGVESIGEEAFEYCKALTDVTIPSSMKRIEKDAFWSCDGLKAVNITDLAAWCSIRFVGDRAYPLGSGLWRHTELYLNGELLREAEFSEETHGHTIGNLSNISSLRKITIPKGVTEISDNAFSGCESLESVIMPDSVIRIGKNAFSGCRNLNSIEFPKSLKCIGDSAFRNCSSLIDITIPTSVTSIGDRAFCGCANLTQAVLPEKLQQIGSHAFASCPKLSVCEIPATIDHWGSIPASYKDGVYYTEVDGRKEILEVFAPGREEYEIPDWASRIREDALVGSPLKRLDVSAGTIFDENIFGKFLFNKPTVELAGSFLETRQELPNYYTKFFEKATKTPEVLTCRMLYQNGKQWNESLTEAAQSADKSAIISIMARIVEENPQEKQAAKLADTVLDYLTELDLSAMQSAYIVLKRGGFKALRKLVLDEAFQEKWLAFRTENNENDNHESDPIEELVRENWKTTEAVKKLRKLVREGVRYQDSEKLSSADVLIFLVNEYADQLDNPASLPIASYQCDYVGGLRFSESADQIAAKLDRDQLREKLEALTYADKTFRNGFVLALARFASGKQISHLCSEMRERANWNRHGVAGRQDVVIGRGALMLSETREAVMALDKAGVLEAYAQMRNTTAEIIRDTVLADFGFDQNGKKIYDLGGNKVSVSMASDLTLLLHDENAGKPVKSIPKKNSDPALFEAAKADFSDLKKNIKRVIKHRRDSIFGDFLSGNGQEAIKWKKVYLGNPVLKALAELIVWKQNEKTFILTDSGPVDYDGTLVTIDDTAVIQVAHPIEMKAEEIKGWQEYFIRYNLKQPFEQIWEPVYDPDSIAPDRYEGAVLPIYRFENKEQHGIHSWGLTAYSESYGFELEDCELDAEGSTWRIIPGETDDETYTLGSFKIINHTRKSNHIIYILDKWTIVDRIEKDDSSIGLMLPSFTLAQITEFIRLANEKQCSNALAVLMDYKNEHFEDADPFAEFTLD